MGAENGVRDSDPALRLVRDQDRATLTLTVEKGQTLEYTFTRGSWSKREADARGQPIPNHALLAETTRAIDLQLAGWSDLRQEVGITTPTPDPSLVNPYDTRVQRVQLLSRASVSYTHLRAHETVLDLVCRLLLEKKNNQGEQLRHTPSYV